VKRPKAVILEGQCAHADACPLSHVQAGAIVCIKQLTAAPEVSSRLREMGFCEEQRIRLVSRHSNFICQVCNARLGISEQLAKTIMVQPVPAHARRS
jgi:Fe2+ transport system protein FeoA